ncbi:hypothetical protein K466DRAFT_667256 [Polyporus arcularius HHB13444]|uniref:F-box domain-containing protein n=1 Tax=Polyporus arcularius HHB13444 TaxID=1314778 RepID=A0A5C3NV86_9APHY|nr:hypothetical protein K466DRAFT_667256 [Polyporus arcularius HHB13444]
MTMDNAEVHVTVRQEVQRSFDLCGLSLDELLDVTAFLARADLSRLARTSRCLYDVILPELVRRAGLMDLEQIKLFHRFLRIDQGSGSPRARWLQRFGYSPTGDCQPDDDGQVISANEGARFALEILRNAPNITSLFLEETRLFDPHDLRTVLTELVRLKFAVIEEIESGSDHDVFLDVTAPLTTVRITMAWTDDFSLGDLCPMSLASLVSIENLILRQVRLSATSCRFPAVRVLDLKRYQLAEGCPALVVLFPAVRELLLGSAFFEMTMPEVELRRAHGRAWQLAHGSWPALDYLSVSDVTTAYALGLTCRVDRLDVWTVSTERETLMALTTLLEDVRPRCFGYFDLDPMHESVPLFLEAMARTRLVTHLVGMLDAAKVNTALGEYMSTLGSHLRDGVVTHVRLQIDFRWAPYPCTHPLRQKRAAEAYKSDVPAAVDTIAAIVPSLRCVLLTFGDLGSNGRRVAEDGTWRYLDDAECRAIEKAERMQDGRKHAMPPWSD